MKLALGTTKLTAIKDGATGWILFDNPGKKNAISDEMWRGLADALADFAADEAVRVVILRGAGEEAFASGADIGEFDTPPEGEPAALRALAALTAFAKPVIAMVDGICFGGGLLVALLADLIYASDRARFRIPAGRLGIGYPYDAISRLVAVAGVAVAADLLLTARTFDGGEAERAGLVRRCLPAAELEASVRETAAMIADNAPLSLKAAKAAIRACATGQGETAEVAALFQACIASADFEEGRRAFREKRRPRFTGR